MNPDSIPTPNSEEIAACAYLIWLEEGRPDGRDMQHWQKAEAQLLAARQHDQSANPTNAEQRETP